TALLFETLQLADQQLCCDRPVLKRGRNPVHLLPIVTDAATIDSGAAKEYSELALALLTCHWVEHLRRQIANTRRKDAAFQLKQTEHQLGVAVGIGEMFLERQLGFVV